jgi:hypothetical protein
LAIQTRETFLFTSISYYRLSRQRIEEFGEAVFCIDALQQALVRGAPEIFNSDQGSK